MAQRLRVAFLSAPALVQRLFPADVLERLSQRFDLVFHNGTRPPSADEVRMLLRGADACVTSWGTRPLTGDLLAEAPDLRLVIHAAGSVKPIVSEALFQRRITVTSAAAAIAKGVAEYTLGLLIISFKNAWQLASITRHGGWRDEAAVARCREMVDVTIGVVGAGHVGREVLRWLRQFPEVEVLLHDPYVTPEQARELGATWLELDELLQRADAVTLHVPSLPETRHLLDRRRLALLKDGAILINTARGALIDEEALVDELRRGRLFACLDVTDPEPPRPDHPLRSLPNVILTPHVAGATTTGLRRIGRYVEQELYRFAAGEPLLYPVPPESLPRIA